MLHRLSWTKGFCAVSFSDGPAPLTIKVVDRVYASLKHLVITYDIRPGQQIPIEDISVRLNASVTPVREALNRLLNDGLIVRKSGRGFYNRDIDLKELTDLFQLRGSLAISACHFVLRSDLCQQIPLVVAQASAADDHQIPICAALVQATGNREMQRIYQIILDKIHFVWKIYAVSARGKEQIGAYRADLLRLLQQQDLMRCIDVIDHNIKQQSAALEDCVLQGLGVLFSQSQPLLQNGS